eukprot:gene7292-5134_t
MVPALAANKEWSEEERGKAIERGNQCMLFASLQYISYRYRYQRTNAQQLTLFL